MPDPALPVNRPEDQDGSVLYRRAFRDALSRPLTGKVVIVGTRRHEINGSVILPVPFTVQLVNGVLEARLPPDTYKAEAELRTREGATVTDAFQITL